jgi:CubicO group peptidase (beta-lactamase class C family)
MMDRALGEFRMRPLRQVRRLIIWGFVALSWTAQADPQQASERLHRAQKRALHEAVAQAVAKHQLVGLQAAVGLRNEVVWAEAFGAADIENRAPLSNESLIRSASVSKWMTATALLHLSEQGRIDLDAPVQRYCQAYPPKQWTLTSRQVLAHRGGVRHYWGKNGEPRDTEEQRSWIEERSDQERLWQIVRYKDVVKPIARFAADPLVFEPGTRHLYSSLGYRLLGCVLQGAAGEDYNSAMQRLVFGPAGMTSTRADDSYAIMSGRARGYVRRDGQLQRSRLRDISENLAAGGHLSTASDLARFALAWNDGVIISDQSRAEMIAPRDDKTDADVRMGYSISVRRAGARSFVFHTGGQEESRTMLLLIPEDRVAVALMSNDEDAEQSLPEIVNSALEIVYRR